MLWGALILAMVQWSKIIFLPKHHFQKLTWMINPSFIDVFAFVLTVEYSLWADYM
jgi:hypothetical protein